MNYEILIKRQAEEIAKLRASIGDAEFTQTVHNELQRLRTELVSVTRELEFWKEFVRSLRQARKIKREIAEFLDDQEDANGR